MTGIKKSSKKSGKQDQQEKLVAVDYDDSDPSSCLAAAAYERGIPLQTIEEQVESCFHHRNGAFFKELARKDRDGVIQGLWRLWNQAHGKYYNNPDQAWWAATQLKALGDQTLEERERGFRRRGR